MIRLRRELASLHAGVAAEERIGYVAPHRHGPVAVDVHLDGAVRMTETAKGFSGMHGGWRRCRPRGLSTNAHAWATADTRSGLRRSRLDSNRRRAWQHGPEHQTTHDR